LINDFDDNVVIKDKQSSSMAAMGQQRRPISSVNPVLTYLSKQTQNSSPQVVTAATLSPAPYQKQQCKNLFTMPDYSKTNQVLALQNSPR
jgi:hypothetical protein